MCSQGIPYKNKILWIIYFPMLKFSTILGLFCKMQCFRCNEGRNGVWQGERGRSRKAEFVMGLAREASREFPLVSCTEDQGNDRAEAGERRTTFSVLEM